MKLLLSTLCICLFVVSCNDQKIDTAKTTVKNYLYKTLATPDSYEPINWGLRLDTNYITVDNIKRPTGFEFFHSYRITDNSGERVIKKEYFILSYDLTRCLYALPDIKGEESLTSK